MAKGDVGSVWLGPLGALMSGQDPLSPAKEPRELGRYEWGWPQDPRAQPPTPHNIPGFPQDVPVHRDFPGQGLTWQLAGLALFCQLQGPQAGLGC